MEGIIAWFARNTVAANLLAGAILFSGIYTIYNNVQVEANPDYSKPRFVIKFTYRGASPEDVEQSVVNRIEESISGVDGVIDMTSTANEAAGSVVFKVADGFSETEVIDAVKVQVDAIRGLPEEVDEMEVTVMSRKRDVISVMVSGDIPENELRRMGRRVQNELSAIEGITQVALSGVRDYEISIEVSEQQLRKYGLTINDVSTAVQRASIDMPGGNIKSKDNAVLVRTVGQAYVGVDFENIVLKQQENGSYLRIGDIAKVNDGFEELPILSRFNGENAVSIDVYRLAKEDALDISKKVKTYINQMQAEMPPGIAISYWKDRSKYIQKRIQSLVDNALNGMILVFIMLSLFLRMKLALWVVFGIPVAVLGSFTFLPVFDLTINYTTMFAFILVLGIVVDDAIVTGENIFKHLEDKSKDSLTAVVEGTREVSTAVTFGVLTTVVAFAALLFIDGERSRMFTMLPLVVIPILLISLVETKLILPAHLKDLGEEKFIPYLTPLRNKASFFMAYFCEYYYDPLLAKCIRRPWVTVAVFVGLLIVCLSMVFSGWIRYSYFPRVNSETARINLEMPIGTPFELTDQYIGRIETAAMSLREKYNTEEETVINDIHASAGILGTGSRNRSAEKGVVQVEMSAVEMRDNKITSMEFGREWLKLVGELPGVEKISMTSYIHGASAPVDVMLRGSNFAELDALAQDIKQFLVNYDGVREVQDSFVEGKEQIKLTIKPEAQLLGLSSVDIGHQVRQAFEGREVQRILRNQDEVKVFVRYPLNERESLATLENMYISNAQGTKIPIKEVVDMEYMRGPAAISHTDGFRTVHVTANVDQKVVQVPNLIEETELFLRDIQTKYPEIIYSFEGESKEASRTYNSLLNGFLLVLFFMYALLAMPFHSYTQPLVVLSVIPFGVLGAIFGHLILGLNLSSQSIMGILALSGVVVNDSLVLVDYINQARRKGVDLIVAASSAGSARFRAIILTSLTTFIGLIPFIFTTNTQAKFLVPLAVSLGFGILFTTFITLILVPCLYVILEKSKLSVAKIWKSKLISKTEVI